MYLREIADHIRQDVGGGVADLIQHLLADRAAVDRAAGPGRLGDDAAPIHPDLGNGVADVDQAVGDVAPIGKITARHLRPAFDQMPRQRPTGQRIEIVRAPAERVDQRTESDGAVHAASGDDDVRAAGERFGDRERAQIGIGGHDARTLGQGIAGEHLGRAVQCVHTVH